MTTARPATWNRRECLAIGVIGLMARAGPRALAGGDEVRWDGEEVREVATLEQPGWAWSVAFSRDGKKLAAGGMAAGGFAPGWITVWDVETWKQRSTFEVKEMRIHRLAFSPGGDEVIAAGLDESRLVACKLGSGECRDLFRKEGRGGFQSPIAFSPEGRYMLSAGPEEGATLWEAKDWRKVQDIRGTRDNTLEIVADHSEPWDFMQGRAYVLDGNGLISVIAPMSSLPPIYGLTRVRGVARPWGAKYLTIARDGKAAAFHLTEEDGTAWVEIYDIAAPDQWRRRAVIDAGDRDLNLISSLTFAPDDRAIIAGCSDRTVRRWDATTGRAFRPLEGHQGSIAGIAVTPGGLLATAGNQDKSVKVWSPPAAVPER